ncbi:MAG: RhsIA family immunity protein [Pseudomonadales bacterium]|nr:RhsIA family immunity protein [Pseudomonadales bacterium]
MTEFDPGKYLVSAHEEKDRSAADTVTEYIQAFQKWAQDCRYWLKQNGDNLEGLKQAGGRDALVQIQSRYCTSKNRQYWRSVGYFFVNGTANAYAKIATEEVIGKNLCRVITEQKKPNSPSFRFTLEQRGKVWRIATLERQDGINQWRPDSL